MLGLHSPCPSAPSSCCLSNTCQELPILFPEPTYFLVSTKTRSSGIINFQRPCKILGLLVSRRMRGLVYMASRGKVDVDTFHKGIQYALEKLRGKSAKFGFERIAVSNFKSKRQNGSGNELEELLTTNKQTNKQTNNVNQKCNH